MASKIYNSLLAFFLEFISLVASIYFFVRCNLACTSSKDRQPSITVSFWCEEGAGQIQWKESDPVRSFFGSVSFSSAVESFINWCVVCSWIKLAFSLNYMYITINFSRFVCFVRKEIDYSQSSIVLWDFRDLNASIELPRPSWFVTTAKK